MPLVAGAVSRQPSLWSHTAISRTPGKDRVNPPTASFGMKPTPMDNSVFRGIVAGKSSVGTHAPAVIEATIFHA
jgi:hypothetical protein